MKRFLSIVCLSVFALTFTSCEKCVTCTTANDSQEFCSKNSTLRDTFASGLEIQGYMCVED